MPTLKEEHTHWACNHKLDADGGYVECCHCTKHKCLPEEKDSEWQAEDTEAREVKCYINGFNQCLNEILEKLNNL